MSRNGSGTYTLPAGNPVVTGTTISSTWANNTLTDIATALTGSLSADGQTTATGALKMGSNKITGLADGTLSTDAATVNQIPDTTTFLLKASNLSDVASASTSRANLGLGTISTQDASSVAITGGTETGIAITSSTIDSTSIGSTTRSTVKATTLDLGLSTQSVAIGQGNASIMKNRIINGAMVIDQRNGGASVTATTASLYTLDRWQSIASVSSKYTVQQNAGSVTPPAGFTNYLGVTSSSAYSVLAGDYFSLVQKIEGYNVADLGFGSANAKTVTLSFWVRSSLTGTFGGGISNAGATRWYPFSYTISSANTWEQKSITIAGDTTGTWVTTSGIGILTSFALGYGSTYGNGTAGAWTSSDFESVTGAVSVVGTSGATFYITGVQLEVGSSATGFEYRIYSTELMNCQRYYEYNGDPSYLSTYAGNAIANVFFKVCKRASPTVTLVSPSSGSISTGGLTNAPWQGFYMFLSGGAGSAVNSQYTASSEL